jgi:uncharacterized C2H2 Zn-finger protein
MTSSKIGLLNFCPECGTTYSYTKNEYGKLVFKCHLCNNVSDKEVVMRFVKSSNIKSDKSKYALPTLNTPYDVTLSNTTKIECPNPTCPCNTEPLSEKYMPKVLLTNKSNSNRIMNMTCVHCSTTWE